MTLHLGSGIPVIPHRPDHAHTALDQADQATDQIDLALGYHDLANQIASDLLEPI